MKEVRYAIACGTRSGSSALRRYLNHDPRILCLHEWGIFKTLNKPVASVVGKLQGAVNPKDVQDYAFQHKGMDLKKLREVLTPGWTGEQALHTLQSCGPHFQAIGDKQIGYVPMIPKLARKIKVIVHVRDGRAVLSSQVRWGRRRAKLGRPLGWQMGTTPEAVQHIWPDICEAQITGMDQARKEGNAHNILFVRHEDILSDLAKWTERIQVFLGLSPQPVDESAPFPEEAGKLYKYQLIREDTWKHEMPSLMNVLTPRFKNCLRYFGYI